jgi:alpha-beta hydrolase superfamily lysophospholipase
MKTHESTLTFPSHDNTSTIHALLWEPADGAADDAESSEVTSAEASADASAPPASAPTQTPTSAPPRGIIQVIHGAAEYCARYRHFAAFFVAAGYVVCADDHIGHGQSASTPETLGHLPLKGGLDILVNDEHQLRQIVAARYPQNTPYIMLGHSMGSFILRAYIARHGTGLAAAIISGTGHQPRALSAFGSLAARIIATFKGATSHSLLLHNLGMGAFSTAISPARTPLDWLSTDPAVVDAYIADPLCGMMFTVGGYATLTELTGDMVKGTAARVPKDLPLLFIAGSEDPVGDKGVAVQKAARHYRQAGVRHVDLKIYEGLRHEILNEPIRESIYQDILTWLPNHP